MAGTPPPSRKLEELTWPEVREALAAGYTTVVVAAGSIEQHGPHLSLLTDTLIGDGLAAAVVARLDGALQGPTIAFGCSEHHMSFPGTITLGEETFKATVKDVARSLGRHGFRTIYFVPSHGGNFAPLRTAIDEIGGRAGEARVIAYTELRPFLEVMYASQEPWGVTPAVAGAHAGNTETALVLALRPDLARPERAEAGFVGDFDERAQATIFRDGLDALSPNGILGDARGADASRGRACLDALAAHLAGWLPQQIEGAGTSSRVASAGG
ncbi:MAG: Creatinine amidohydrolase [uncultured Thermomicrobiales bacterium]|uniref:Creatinine amidohydrolase n=1 Tax=uncultured Thermomicrobiales bacterium TaxID=1645740 RepID=A0A6J4UED9_9BACT|nr:MAG: Creatinine amidohydrolase [uncultured Thermomicrobiales bacterium]